MTKLNIRNISYNHIALAIIILASAIAYFSLSAMNGFKIGFYDDSGSYFIASDVFMRGEIDFLRTPLYPLICRFSAWLSAKNALIIIVAMQETVFLCSVVAIFSTIITLGINRNIAVFVTSTYALCPILILYSNLIFTESLAISFSAFFACALANMLFGKHKLFAAIITPLLLFFMIMLRPFYVCFIPVAAIVLLYSLYVNRHHKRHAIGIVISSGIVACSLFAYCMWYYKSYDKFSFSCVYELNRDVALSDWNLNRGSEGIIYYKYNTPPDINGISVTLPVAWRWKPSEEYRKHCDNAYEEHKVRYIKNKIIEFHSALYHRYCYANKHIPIHYYLGRLISVSISQICLFILIFIFIEALFIKYKSRLSIMSGCMAILCIATIFTSIWGAYVDYERLIMPMMPCLFIMAAIFTSRFSISIKQMRQ